MFQASATNMKRFGYSVNQVGFGSGATVIQSTRFKNKFSCTKQCAVCACFESPQNFANYFISIHLILFHKLYHMLRCVRCMKLRPFGWGYYSDRRPTLRTTLISILLDFRFLISIAPQRFARFSINGPM